MVYHERGLHNYLYHAIENTVADPIDPISATYARSMMGRLDVRLYRRMEIGFSNSEF